MKYFKEIIKFLLGFMPWILFLFIAGNTFASLQRAIVICFVTSVLFGFRELRGGFILQWGTFLFFVWCLVMVNVLKVTAIATNMGLLANGFLASIIWLTILIGKPFTLQYARADLPKERWNEPQLVRSCRFIAIVWGLLLTFSACVSYFRAVSPGRYPEWCYFSVSIGTIIGGTIFTQAYKDYRRAKSQKIKLGDT